MSNYGEIIVSDMMSNYIHFLVTGNRYLSVLLDLALQFNFHIRIDARMLAFAAVNLGVDIIDFKGSDIFITY